VVASYLFDGYGVRKVASSDPTAPQDPYSGYGGLAGYYADWETGLSLLGFRYYDVLAGRFLTRDPIGFEGGINLYEYLGNNPVMEQDYGGLLPKFLQCLIQAPRLVGAFWGAAFSCFGLIQKLIRGENGSWCKLITSCAMGTACSGLVSCFTLMIRTGGMTLVIACAIGAICSILNSTLAEFCSAHTCTESWSRWFKHNWICLLINAAMSCAAGALGGIIGGGIPIKEPFPISGPPEYKYNLPGWVQGIIMGHLKFLGYGVGMTCSVATGTH
jgi:RHS repeat-associated protein